MLGKPFIKRQSGQAVIESCWITVQLVLVIQIFIFLTYLLYTSVISKYIVYELAICHSRILQNHHCTNHHRKKIEKLLPFGRLKKITVRQNRTAKKITSLFQFTVSVPLIEEDINFNESFYLTFPLKDK